MLHNVFVGVVLLVWLSPVVLAGVILYRLNKNKSNEHPHVCVANSVGVCRCGHNVVE